MYCYTITWYISYIIFQLDGSPIDIPTTVNSTTGDIQITKENGYIIVNAGCGVNLAFLPLKVDAVVTLLVDKKFASKLNPCLLSSLLS